MSEALGIEIFPCSVLGQIIIVTEPNKQTKLLKIKPTTFVGFTSKDIFEFIVNCYERL